HPALLWFTAQDNPAPPENTDAVIIPVPETWMQSLAEGDVISLMDTRGRLRGCRVVHKTPQGAAAEAFRTAYVQPGTMLRVFKTNQATRDGLETTVGPLPHLQRTVSLHAGDRL